MTIAREQLEAALFDLGGEIEYPPTPALASQVRARIEAGEFARGGRWWRRTSLAAAAAILLLGAVMVFSPAARTAVADLLGLEGAEIEVKPTPVPTEIPVLGDDLDLGDPVTRAEAEQDAGFELLIPGELGPPDEFYVDTFAPRLVSLVYAPTDEIPQSQQTGVGVLISQFRGRLARGPLLEKTVFTGGRVEPVKVNGEPGYWITGTPHQIYFRDDAGNVFDDSLRLAGNTLIWESGQLTLRLEAKVTKAEALRIARSMR